MKSRLKATLHDDLNERVQALAKERRFDVLKVRLGSSVRYAPMHTGESSDDESIDALLGDPRLVFENILSTHQQFDEKEVNAVKLCFAQILELVEQSEPAVIP